MYTQVLPAISISSGHNSLAVVNWSLTEPVDVSDSVMLPQLSETCHRRSVDRQFKRGNVRQNGRSLPVCKPVTAFTMLVYERRWYVISRQHRVTCIMLS